jgi:hypothetical protein
MKKYCKEINGEKITKNRSQIVITKNGMSTYNPTETMIIDDGWEEYIPFKPQKTLQDYKNEKIEEVKRYDKSSFINEFYIQGLPIWLDKPTRVGLKLRFESEIAMGKNETILWHNNHQFPLTLNDAINMLFAIELYASACYDNTHYHISQINLLDNIDDVLNYDYCEGYPEKLNF